VAAIARRLAPYCARSASRPRASAYRQGLRRAAARKHSWQLADVWGEATPSGVPSGLNRADGDADAGRDERCRSVIQQLGDPNGVLGLDETGLLNKGAHSAGVARQYSGTAGTVEPGQIGVWLGDARGLGQVLLDRALSRPAAWPPDRERCRPAGIPADRDLATTPP
jgi:SRSO17 transposase